MVADISEGIREWALFVAALSFVLLACIALFVLSEDHPPEIDRSQDDPQD